MTFDNSVLSANFDWKFRRYKTRLIESRSESVFFFDSNDRQVLRTDVNRIPLCVSRRPDFSPTTVVCPRRELRYKLIHNPIVITYSNNNLVPIRSVKGKNVLYDSETRVVPIQCVP